MKTQFYARKAFESRDGWSVWKRTRTGDRRVGTHMSEQYARRIAKLLNAEERVRVAVESFDVEAYEASMREDEETARRWNEYWNSLTPEERARELQSMADHVATHRGE